MKQFVRLAGLVVVLGFAACSSSDSGSGGVGGAGGNAGSTSAGGAAGMGGSSGAGGISAAGGYAASAGSSGTSGTSGSGGNGGVGGTGAAGGDGGACGPTLMGQGCPDAGETCAYPSHQCRCAQGLWICSLCPDIAPLTGASCASMISVCTYPGANQCTCGGVPLPVWSCTKS